MVFLGHPVTEEPNPNASSLLHSPYFGNLLSRVLKELTKEFTFLVGTTDILSWNSREIPEQKYKHEGKFNWERNSSIRISQEKIKSS